MQDFNLYFGLGIEHILTWDALDHILFVTALCLRYRLADWKKVAILVTAFTIGHSLTLILSVLGYITVAVPWIEFLIALTIAGTALNNLFYKPGTKTERLPVIYFFALFFGMIHGLAYANLLLDLEGGQNLTSHLLAFNLGIEVGQLLVVAVVLVLSFIFVEKLKIPQRWWIAGWSVLILLFALKIAIERIPEQKKKIQTAIEYHEKNPVSVERIVGWIGYGPEHPEQSRL